MSNRFRFILDSNPLIPNSQAGQSTVYIILVIIVIIFAVMLAGGGSSLFSGDQPSSVTDAPSPSIDTNSTPSASDSATPSSSTTTPNPAAWTITVNLGSCTLGKSPYMAGTLKVEGPTTALVTLLVGSKIIDTKQFTPTVSNYSPFNLNNDDGFNINTWKITVTADGVVQKTFDGSPTGC